MSQRLVQLSRVPRNAFSISWCAGCTVLLAVACTPQPEEKKPPPVEERAEMQTKTVEPNETRGAPYPPAKPSDRIPNLEEDEEWPRVPDGPRVGDMQPANPQVGVKEIEVDDQNEEVR